MASTQRTPGKGGRQAEAAVNDDRILQAARDVFVTDPGAPIAAVAKHAGVGMSALYRRYPSKTDLLRRICTDGMQAYLDEVNTALADDGDPWDAFVAFMHGAVEADSGSLTARLAGTFEPTAEMFAMSEELQARNDELFARTRDAGVLRPGLEVNDLGPIVEAITSIKYPDAERTRTLRHRYLHLMLQSMRAGSADDELPGPAPTWPELSARWRP